MSVWTTALLLGLTGSFHCIWMCGPLVIAATSTQPRILVNKSLYNTGRILTYSVLGAIGGTAGLAVDLAGWSNVASIAIGVGLIALGIAGVTRIKIPGVTPTLNLLHSKLKGMFSHFIARRTKTSMFFMGTVNGLLPCGLTYLALIYTLTLDPVSGFAFMAIFGSATLPAMLGVTSIMHQWLLKFRLDVKKLTVSVMIVVGVLLLSRSYFHIGHNHHSAAEVATCGE